MTQSPTSSQRINSNGKLMASKIIVSVCASITTIGAYLADLQRDTPLQSEMATSCEISRRSNHALELVPLPIRAVLRMAA